MKLAPEPAMIDVMPAQQATISQGSGEMTIDTKMVPYYGGDDFAPGVYNRSYQQSMSYGVVVKDVSSYIQRVRNSITSQGGIVTNQSLNRSDKYISAYLNARVPVDKLDAVSNQVLEGVKQVANQNVSATDVTAYRKDMQDTIDVIKRQIAEQELMLTQAKTEYEKKKISLQIESLRSQLKSYQRQMEDSQNQVAYATLDLTAADTMKYFDGSRVGVWDELSYSMSSLGSVIWGAVRLAIWVGVYSLVWLPILLIIRWVFGRK